MTYALHAQLASLMDVPASTMRGRIKELGTRVAQVRQNNELQAIKRLRFMDGAALDKAAPRVSVVTVRDAANVWKMGLKNAIGFESLLLLAKREPPPVRQYAPPVPPPQRSLVPALPPLETAVAQVQTTQHVHSPVPAPAQFRTPAPLQVTFPSRLPEIPPLLRAQKEERYGLQEHQQSEALKTEIEEFRRYCTDKVNTLRSPRYMRATQSTSMEKVPVRIRAFLGCISKYYNVGDIGIDSYHDPNKLAWFVSYLQARGVRVGSICNHLSLARKINDYLISGAPENSTLRAHGAKMEQWLGTLEAQVRASMPMAKKPEMPPATEIYAWAIDLAKHSLQRMERDLAILGHMSEATARMVQQATIVILVTGTCTPPVRLSFVKSAIHPSFNRLLKCIDPDCVDPNCMGNRLELIKRGDAGWAQAEADSKAGISSWVGTGAKDDCGDEAAGEDGVSAPWAHYNYQDTAIQSVIVHHKNDQRPRAASVRYTIPDGPLKKLLLAHCCEGHRLLSDETMPRLFTTNGRPPREFDDVRFCQWWRTTMDSTTDIMYFRPSLARTTFVEDYTGEHGVEPNVWDGAATIMGNTVRQWHVSYNRVKQAREAQQAVARHAEYVNRRIQEHEGGVDRV